METKKYAALHTHIYWVPLDRLTNNRTIVAGGGEGGAAIWCSSRERERESWGGEWGKPGRPVNVSQNQSEEACTFRTAIVCSPTITLSLEVKHFSMHGNNMAKIFVKICHIDGVGMIKDLKSQDALNAPQFANCVSSFYPLSPPYPRL